MMLEKIEKVLEKDVRPKLLAHEGDVEIRNLKRES